MARSMSLSEIAVELNREEGRWCCDGCGYTQGEIQYTLHTAMQKLRNYVRRRPALAEELWLFMEGRGEPHSNAHHSNAEGIAKHGHIGQRSADALLSDVIWDEQWSPVPEPNKVAA